MTDVPLSADELRQLVEELTVTGRVFTRVDKLECRRVAAVVEARQEEQYDEVVRSTPL